MGLIPFVIIQTLILIAQCGSGFLLTLGVIETNSKSYPLAVTSSVFENGSTKHRILSLWVKIMVVLGTFGTVIGVWECAIDVVTEILENSNVSGFLSSRIFVALICCVLSFPFSITQNMADIAFTSQLSLLGILIFSIMVIVNACMGIDLNGIKFFGSLSDFPEALGICIFQYIWHFNHVAIYRSLENKSEINKVVASGSVLAYTLICVLSIVLYITFGTETNANILINFNFVTDGMNLNVTFATILRLAAAISTLCSGPCFILECKANLYQCFSQNFIIPRIPNFILTFLVIFTSCMIAALVSNIGIVLSITGCLCGSQICYLFPSAIGLSLGNSARNKFLAVISLTIGAVALVLTFLN